MPSELLQDFPTESSAVLRKNPRAVKHQDCQEMADCGAFQVSPVKHRAQRWIAWITQWARGQTGARIQAPQCSMQRIVSQAERFLGARWIYLWFFKQILPLIYTLSFLISNNGLGPFYSHFHCRLANMLEKSLVSRCLLRLVVWSDGNKRSKFCRGGCL